MSEKVTLYLDKWKDVTDNEIGLTSGDLKTELHRYKNDQNQEFNIFIADARKSADDPTIISSTSFDYRIDPLLENSTKILANRSNARVIVSEIPGITMDRDHPYQTTGAWQTPRQTLLAFSGDFDPLTYEMLNGIKAVAGLERGAKLQFKGNSLGAYAVVSMARNIALRRIDEDYQITRMDLIEPVNSYGNYTLARQAFILRSLATTEDQRRQLYLGENTTIGHGEIKAFEQQSDENMRIDRYIKSRPRQILATYLTGAGLRKGLDSALKDALSNRDSDGPHLREAKIVIARGIDSTVSFENDLISVADTVRENGGQVQTISLKAETGDTTPIGHHVLDSYARLASYTDERLRDIKNLTVR
jgi:hypothetical protein